MNALRTPAVVLGVLYSCFISTLVFAFTHLPTRVATHFDASGQPNGWMNRDIHLWHMTMLGIAFPLLVPVILYASRFLPDGLFHIAHHNYWFAPARRSQTLAYIFRHSLWFASLALGFVIGIHVSIIQSNLAQVQLSPLWIFPVVGGFLVGTIIWAAIMIRHFNSVAA
ncbi:MAG: DUF1648 domain-containing protein [Verrucomicrobia bacterium]|nr:DUF1648 domain-containing protein [Verrucomicrobiota bacterium]